MVNMLRNPFFRYGAIISGTVLGVMILFPEVKHGLLRADEFMPHATCYLRNPKIILLHVSSDVLIGASYLCIAFTLGYLVHRGSKDIPFHWMFLAFGLFIVTCGFTHLMEVWTVWQAVYWLAGYVKLITAMASVTTAVALLLLIPKIFSLIEALKISEQRRIKLEAANTELESFAYSVSHDLRAPLRAVQGMASAMTEDYRDRLDPGGQEYLERISGASKRMDVLIQDILSYTRVGRVDLSLEPVDTGAAVEAALESVAADIAHSGAEVRREEPLLPVRANKTLLVQVLANLLSNALKFVGPGKRPVI
ncbi:MAG TPA: histidine kinase dimerization/phospho-acceptor domain-containing protein, partial [Clostridia bacterium]|nr:histidine kinase dimerization/phospho-acceptor domain-containing protein [Clostridia bacterium]